MRQDIKKSGASRMILRRMIIYSIMTLILGTTQCAFFPFIDICPATPDLILGMLLAISLLDSQKSAAICAVAAGFFMDAIGSYGIALSPLIYLFFIVLIGALSRKVLKSFASFALLLIPSVIYRGAVTFAMILFKNGVTSPLSASVFTQVIIPEILMTGLLCMPIYFIVKLCSGAFENHSRFSF
jgi:cell shape-determining protein MreD